MNIQSSAYINFTFSLLSFYVTTLILKDLPSSKFLGCPKLPFFMVPTRKEKLL